MEDELDDIARGDREYEKTLKDFYGPFEKAVKAKDKLPKATSLGDVSKEFPCPVCESEMEYKLGRGGVFMSCKRYPECKGARLEDGTELKEDEPIGLHPETKAPIYVRTGRFGPYVEMALPQEVSSASPKATQGGRKRGRGRPRIAAKRVSVPKGKNPAEITLEDAVKYLTLPRELGTHPSTGKPVVASVGRFGPYVGHDGDFRSIKKGDPYTITFDEALALISEPKKPPKGVDIVREIGPHPRTKKPLILYKSKSGFFLRKSLRRIYLHENVNADSLTPEEAAELLK
jgi:DNA topoisomerase-1